MAKVIGQREGNGGNGCNELRAASIASDDMSLLSKKAACDSAPSLSVFDFQGILQTVVESHRTFNLELCRLCPGVSWP